MTRHPQGDAALLIERLEKATEPDRELDAAIFALMHPEKEILGHHYRNQIQFLEPLPRFTASLDATLTLAKNQGEVFLVLNAVLNSLIFHGRMAELKKSQVNLWPAIQAALITAIKAREAARG